VLVHPAVFKSVFLGNRLRRCFFVSLEKPLSATVINFH
jgi:hypothetical protein